MELERGQRKTRTYLVFDKKTGRILLRYQRIAADTGESQESDPNEVRKIIEGDPSMVALVSGRDASNLDVMVHEGASPSAMLARDFLVDAHRKSLKPKSRVALSADREELAGDGADRLAIEIRVIDPHGTTDASFSGTLKVTTSRGRLSARGGLVRMEKGIGRVQLTSAAETVDRVALTARSMDHTLVEGSLTLAFV